MFIPNFIIAAAIVSMLGYGVSNINTNQMKNAVVEREQEVSMSMLQRGLASYYYTHSKTYPDALDKDTLIVMGLENLDISTFSYKLNPSGTYTLTYIKADGTEVGGEGGEAGGGSTGGGSTGGNSQHTGGTEGNK